MNVQRIQELFTHYIDMFDVINNEKYHEYHKWIIAKQYRTLMDNALAVDGPEFADALYKVSTCTEHIINSFTQPFYGLVQFARKEPETVRRMFLDLYADDGGDLHVQEQIISDFFGKSDELLDKYFPDSYRFKQNSHSVSTYLFFYDPEHHYMYKATESRMFADCIEFYDEWGTGDNIKLDVYYRMCDWIVEQIMQSPELLSVDESRFHLPEGGEMHPDKNKHILCIDLIYCSFNYDVYGKIKFKSLRSKERKMIVENRQKANELLSEYEKAFDAQQKLEEAMYIIKTQLAPGSVIVHKTFGEGKVLSCDGAGNAEVSFAKGGDKRLNLPTVFGSNLAKTDRGWVEEALAGYVPYLHDARLISERVESTRSKLEPFKEYLED